MHWTLSGTDPRSHVAGRGTRDRAGRDRRRDGRDPDEAARCLIVALHAAHHGAAEDAPLYDLERAVAVAGRTSWAKALELARAAGAETAFLIGLALVPSGELLRTDFGLAPPPLTERLAMNLGPPVAGTRGFYWFAQQRGIRARARFVARKLVPPAAFMRVKYPHSRKGHGRLALAYLYRPFWIARWALPGFLSWRRARKRATASDRQPEVRGRDAILRGGNAILAAHAPVGACCCQH